jgi:hypothetical protein
MMLIVFLLLVVIVLAVGVRILEAGSKVALAVALLVAVGLGIGLASQYAAIPTNDGVIAAENDEREQPASPAEALAAKSSSREDDENTTPAAADADIADTAVSDETQADSASTAESEGGNEDEGDADDGEFRLVTSVPSSGRPRPEWLESEDVRTGEIDGVDTTAVCSGPFEHLGECRPALDAALEQAVSDYIDDYLGPVYGENFKASSVVSYEAQYIREHLVGADNLFDEKRELSFGPMYQSHALIKFTPEFRQVLDERRSEVDHQWQQFVVTGRLLGVALVFGLILAFLAVVSGYFRLDTATRGFYTARLQFLAAVAILAVIVAGALLARNVPWM